MLQSIDNIQLLGLHKLIWKRDIEFPLLDDLLRFLQTEAKNSGTPNSPRRALRCFMDEDRILAQKMKIHRNQWARISSSLPGRSPDEVKKRSTSKTFIQ